MPKLGPTIALQDLVWWLLAVMLALVVAGAGAAMRSSRGDASPR